MSIAFDLVVPKYNTPDWFFQCTIYFSKKLKQSHKVLKMMHESTYCHKSKKLESYSFSEIFTKVERGGGKDGGRGRQRIFSHKGPSSS